MIKRIILLLLLCSVLTVHAEYYSISDSSFDGDKKIFFERGLTVTISDSNIYVDGNSSLKSLFDSNSPRQFSPVDFSEIDKKNYNISECQQTTFHRYNFAYVFSQTIEEACFFIVTPANQILVQQKKEASSLPVQMFSSNVDVVIEKIFAYKLFSSDMKFLDDKSNLIVSRYMDSDRIMGVSVGTSSVSKLLKVESERLTEFLKEKESRKVIVDTFLFSEEKLYLTYLAEIKSSFKRLKVTYEQGAKKIKAILEANANLLDPESKSSDIVTDIGVIYNYKNKDLYELKKVQAVDGQIDLSWENHPKKKVLVVDYLNDGVKDRKILSKNKGQQFYAFDAVTYLVYWMKKNNIDNKVFTFMNGSLPFDVTMKRDAENVFSIYKQKHKIYSFIFNKAGFVSEITYPDYEIKLKLEQVDTGETIKNKEFLSNFMEQHNIIRVKE
jgi:hypothetical protein